nr:DNA-3-methyladenine glycosylase I [Marinomonas sp. 15G1-11]
MSDQRCGWCLGTPEYIAYHDNEWGKAVYDDQTLFEFIVLESAQAGLSWITILKKEPVMPRHSIILTPSKSVK